MKKYLITGVAGFIGYSTTIALLDSGCEVVGLDNFNDGYDVRLKHWRLCSLLNRKFFQFQETDICDFADVQELFKLLGPFDAVLHFAGRTGVRNSTNAALAHVRDNVLGTSNIFEASCRLDCPKIVLASSSSVYGIQRHVPYHEADDTSHPVSIYAATKKSVEVIANSYHATYGVDVSILRLFTVYGPACRPDMSPFRFVRAIVERKPVRIFGKGDQLRDFTHISDVVRASVAAMRPMGYEVFNIGGGRPITVLDAVKAIENSVGYPANLEFESENPADVPITYADSNRAAAALNWKAEINFEDGIETVINWYKENREMAMDLVG